MMTTMIKIQVFGLVQGVCFRAWVQKTALERNLKGWVRNRLDGSVEMVLIGPKNKVEEMIQLVKTGPEAAHVDHIHSTEIQETNNHEDFEILPTI